MVLPPFLNNLWKMIEDEETDHIISWYKGRNDAFCIKDVKAFENEVLLNYFKHNKFQSFIRQLNMYDFTKIRDTHCNAWKHEGLKRGDKTKLITIRRKNASDSEAKAHSQVKRMLSEHQRRIESLESELDQEKLVHKATRKKMDTLQQVVSSMMSFFSRGTPEVGASPASDSRLLVDHPASNALRITGPGASDTDPCDEKGNLQRRPHRGTAGSSVSIDEIDENDENMSDDASLSPVPRMKREPKAKKDRNVDADDDDDLDEMPLANLTSSSSSGHVHRRKSGRHSHSRPKTLRATSSSAMATSDTTSFEGTTSGSGASGPSRSRSNESQHADAEDSDSDAERIGRERGRKRGRRSRRERSPHDAATTSGVAGLVDASPAMSQALRSRSSRRRRAHHRHTSEGIPQAMLSHGGFGQRMVDDQPLGDSLVGLSGARRLGLSGSGGGGSGGGGSGYQFASSPARYGSAGGGAGSWSDGEAYEATYPRAGSAPISSLDLPEVGYRFLRGANSRSAAGSGELNSQPSSMFDDDPPASLGAPFRRGGSDFDLAPPPLSLSTSQQRSNSLGDLSSYSGLGALEASVSSRDNRRRRPVGNDFALPPLNSNTSTMPLSESDSFGNYPTPSPIDSKFMEPITDPRRRDSIGVLGGLSRGLNTEPFPSPLIDSGNNNSSALTDSIITPGGLSTGPMPGSMFPPAAGSSVYGMGGGGLGAGKTNLMSSSGTASEVSNLDTGATLGTGSDIGDGSIGSGALADDGLSSGSTGGEHGWSSSLGSVSDFGYDPMFGGLDGGDGPGGLPTIADAGPSGSGLIDSEDEAELEALGRDSSDVSFGPVKEEMDIIEVSPVPVATLAAADANASSPPAAAAASLALARVSSPPSSSSSSSSSMLRLPPPVDVNASPCLTQGGLGGKLDSLPPASILDPTSTAAPPTAAAAAAARSMSAAEANLFANAAAAAADRRRGGIITDEEDDVSASPVHRIADPLASMSIS